VGAGPVTVPKTLNPPAKVACSLPVCATGARGPNAAPASIVIGTVASVALVTVTGPNPPAGAPPTDTPGPKLTCVTPCTKFVKLP